LNQDLSREYQAIIGYVVYSQVLKGAEFMNIAGELEKHAAEELSHALIIAKQIDYLGGMPAVEAKTVRTSEKAREMLQFDLENETETIRNYRERVRQCEELAGSTLERLHIPRSLAAASIVLAGIGLIGLLGYALYERAMSFAEELPVYASTIQQTIAPISRKIQNFQQSAGNLGRGRADGVRVLRQLNLHHGRPGGIPCYPV